MNKRTSILLLVLCLGVFCEPDLDDLGFNSVPPGGRPGDSEEVASQSVGGEYGPTRNYCGPGCVTCGEYRCDVCYRRKTNGKGWDSGSIPENAQNTEWDTEEEPVGSSYGSQCDARILPPNPVSDFYAYYDENLVTHCKKPFAFANNQCTRIYSVPNCAVYGRYRNGDESCDVCYGGVPIDLGRKCSSSYPKSPHTDWKGCDRAMFNPIRRRHECVNCTNGYVLNGQGFCQQRTAELEGCKRM